MTSALPGLVAASWRAVGRRTPVLAPATAAVLLLAVTWPLQDGRYAGHVLHGLVLLSATVLIGATDDPAAEICATSPHVLRLRTALRVLTGSAVALPVLAGGLTLVHLRCPQLPLTPYVVEAAGLCLVALALGVGLRAWLDLAHPSYAASIGLIGIALVAFLLPQGWGLLEPQPWGPPWAATRWRWLAVGLVAVGLSLAATADRSEGR
ncbi:hypothetical protein GCM10022237_07150 [Nocardioides ginsengisoli]|uniref:ABC transporter n=1 Tax=Nocardioides ginsengisoli TaxID=363868 RepID=A0ABW3VVE5_9ACTN